MRGICTNKDTEKVKQSLIDAGQHHIADYIKDDSSPLIHQCAKFDVKRLPKVFEKAREAECLVRGRVYLPPVEVTGGDVLSGNLPTSGCFSLYKADIQEREAKELYQSGIGAISQGEVALVIMAGGQGTRLGYDGPKGAFPLYPSGESLFCIVISKVKCLIQTIENEGMPCPPIHLFIMTSDANHAATTNHLESNEFFGYPQSHIHLFQQNMIPTLTMQGKMFLLKADKLAMHPNGNGGIYMSLKDTGMIDIMEKNNVKAVHIIAVDNAFVLPLDPLFIGFCKIAELDCANKCVERTDPNEKVGVTANLKQPDGSLTSRVVEYYELPQSMSSAESKDKPKRLYYNCANIANHYMTVKFINKLCSGGGVLEHDDESWHRAMKVSPVYNKQMFPDSSPKDDDSIIDCVKLELFVFDAFKFADRVGCFVVSRDEFGPLKNKSGKDSPTDVLEKLSALHKKWVAASGSKIPFQEGGLLSVDATYNGENLGSRS